MDGMRIASAGRFILLSARSDGAKRWSLLSRSEKDEAAYAWSDAGDYVLGEDSIAKAGVPKGAIVKYRLDGSGVYPGTVHDYWIYVPAQYSGHTPACLMVFLDGSNYLEPHINAATVLDNLIHHGRVPTMLGLFLDPGSEGPGMPLWGGSGNRSVEYDSMTGDFARFLIDEVLAEVERCYCLTDDPDRRGIAGSSSGGIAAFTVAWHRCDAFRKVASFVGSFVDIRGGNQYPALIRRCERKPIRAFLQTGARDLDVVFGNWVIANQDMAAALAYRDYDHQFVIGAGGHSNKHAAAILPDVLRWLWR
jgi:enterochelin esterase family protein